MKTIFASVFALAMIGCQSKSDSELARTPQVTRVNLDSHQYCRSVRTGGIFGQPAGVRLHCVSFAKGKMIDNANTFFGNPPETTDYKVVRNVIYAKRSGRWVKRYTLKDGNLDYGTGAILKRTLEGRRFCRKVGQRQHCVSFAKGKMIDNANTFFGNPPEKVSYRTNKDQILVKKNNKWVKSYKIKNSTLIKEKQVLKEVK